MTRKTAKNLLRTLLIVAGLYGLVFAVFRFGAESTICITDTWCPSTRDNILALTLLQGAFILLLVLIAALTFRIMIWLVRIGLGIYVGAGVMMFISLLATIILFLVTPADELTDFIHIIVISAFFFLFGIFMIVATRRKSGRNRRRKA